MQCPVARLPLIRTRCSNGLPRPRPLNFSGTGPAPHRLSQQTPAGPLIVTEPGVHSTGGQRPERGPHPSTSPSSLPGNPTGRACGVPTFLHPCYRPAPATLVAGLTPITRLDEGKWSSPIAKAELARLGRERERKRDEECRQREEAGREEGEREIPTGSSS